MSRRSDPRRDAAGASRAGAAGEALLVAARPWLTPEAHAWIPLRPGDRVLVTEGQALTPETVVAERLGDARIAVVGVRRADAASILPGGPLPGGGAGRQARGRRPEEEGTVLHRMPDGRVRAVVGRLREPIAAHVAGRVAAVGPGAVEVVLEGSALALAAVAGQATHGPLRLATHDPGSELRPGALHVADAGAILVAGGRVDVETLTRARAMGIRGIVTGGIAGHDLRDFVASETRQRAALHQLPAFAVAVVEGFGRRTLAGPPFELLTAVAGAGVEVAILPDPPLLAFPRGVALPAVPAGLLRVAAGPGAGATGRLDGPAALVRFAEGTHLLAASFVSEGRRWTVPLADLERFQ